mgnify:CR=1 FL=1
MLTSRFHGMYTFRIYFRDYYKADAILAHCAFQHCHEKIYKVPFNYYGLLKPHFELIDIGFLCMC